MKTLSKITNKLIDTLSGICIFVAIVLATVLSIGCGSAGGDNGGDKNITVAITMPDQGSVLYGSAEFRVAVVGQTAGARLLFADGKPLCDTTVRTCGYDATKFPGATCYTCMWDTMTLNNGGYTFLDGNYALKAVGVDATGKDVGASSTVNVTVTNACRPWFKDLQNKAVTDCTYPGAYSGMPVGTVISANLTLKNYNDKCEIWANNMPGGHTSYTNALAYPPIYSSTAPGSTIVLHDEHDFILTCKFK